MLIAISFLFFAFALGLFVSGFPLRYYIFGLPEEGGGRPIGIVRSVDGGLRRQQIGESEFIAAPVQATLFDQDTVVTGPDSKATLQLDDGSTIELGPSTMIRLSFGSNFNLGGITRLAKIEVVAGSVTGDSKGHEIILRSREKVVRLGKNQHQSLSVTEKVALAPKPRPRPSAEPSPMPTVAIAAPPPSPSPEPSPSPAKAVAKAGEKIELLSPKRGSKLAVEKGSPEPERAIDLSWSATEQIKKVRITVTKRADPPKVVLSQVADMDGGSGQLQVRVRTPGAYSWKIEGLDADEADLSVASISTFTVDKEFEGIKTNEPLVGGQKASTNKFEGDKQIKKFDILLSWQPYVTAKNYDIKLLSSPTAEKPLLTRKLPVPEYSLNNNKIFSGEVYYQVSAELPSGFIVKSPVELFNFDFMPPTLVMPLEGANLPMSASKSSTSSVLFTWQKTNFTESYDFEFYSDEALKNLLATKRVPENFYVFKGLKPGSYWWRVRAHAKTMTSGYSRPRSFTLTP